MSVFWTREKTSFLKQCWRQGMSARWIAERMGATRNAVIGKVHRLELPIADRTHRDTRATVSKVALPPQPPPLKPQAVNNSVTFLPRGTATTLLMSMSADNCRWPDGDPSGDDFTFCAGKKHMNFPYCKAHCDISYNVQRPRSGR
jgi:GcrA cell cycle regulator